MEDKKNITKEAPKESAKKRSCIYIMLETVIEATPRSDAKPSQEIYLDNGRLKNKVEMTSEVSDQSILKLLEDCNGFHKLVHSIGVSVVSDRDKDGTVDFLMQNWGKENIYETGTHISIPCKLDASETVIVLDDYEWSQMDDIVGKFAFEFDNIGDIATATVKLYLNDGYEVPEITLEAPVDYNTSQYKKMISRSLLYKGNNRRLKAAIENAKRGEDVTIAYIGASLTQGAGAKPINKGCYAYKSYMKFRELFGKDDGSNVHFVKAGVGGTPSQLGMIRYDRDILRDGKIEPDIVVIEFAVNDEGDETKGACFESLCLKALKEKCNTAVILLFSVFLNDWNLQDRLAPIGENYNLPMVSVKDAVVEQFKLSKEEGGIISKRQYFYDIFHPTNDGHNVMADCLANLFEETDKTVLNKDDINLNIRPIKGNDFVDVHLLDRKDNYDIAIISEGGFNKIDKVLQMVEMDADYHQTPQFPYNWMHSASSGNESFRMTIESKNLNLVYKDSGDIIFGKAEVLVDGEIFNTLDPHKNNWTHCNPIILYQEDVCRRHEIEIRMASGDEDKCFTILGFGYTR